MQRSTVLGEFSVLRAYCYRSLLVDVTILSFAEPVRHTNEPPPLVRKYSFHERQFCFFIDPAKLQQERERIPNKPSTPHRRPRSTSDKSKESEEGQKEEKALSLEECKSACVLYSDRQC
jgi:hypothetical protein